MSESSHPPTDDDFFTAVEQYVTPAMAAHGYVVCWAGEGKASDTGSALRRVPSWRAHWLLRNRAPRPLGTRHVRHLSAGYEDYSGNELSVEYFPERYGLDLTWWRHVLRERADFDVSGTDAVDRDELRRRLRVLGDAVREAATLQDD